MNNSLTQYFNPVKVVQTNSWLIELNDQQEKLAINSPLVITSAGNRKRLNLDSIFSSSSIFDNCNVNPTFDDCERAIQFCQDKTIDGIVAIGGGSVMDLAKVVIANVCLELNDINNLISFDSEYPKTIPSIFLPTTHGTASEVTMWGTIWDMDEKKKYSISNPSLYPTIAILDGSVTLSLSLENSIITVLDALSHGFESIWNKNKNSTTVNFAIDSIVIILKNIDSFKSNTNNLELRNKLLIAANKAGLAFSNTKTAAAHSISYPLTSYYDIPHGIASSLSLIPLMEINGPSVEFEFNKIIEDSGLKSIDDLKSLVKTIPQSILKYSLHDWGMRKNDIDFIVEKSFTKGRMENNIVNLNESNVKEILEKIFFLYD